VSYRFTASTRALTLDEGQAFFEVKKAPDRPFVVETGRGRIVAVGTAFSVDVMPDRLNVTVAEGTVRIETGQQAPARDISVARAAVVVTAGRRYVSASSGAQVDALPASAPPVSWREGRLAYYGDPLSAVVTDLNRYAPDRIEIADPELGDLQYTGTVFPEHVSDWLTSLPNAFPVRVERRAHGWLIVRRSASPASLVVTTP
jgi:transmembrane sensor